MTQTQLELIGYNIEDPLSFFDSSGLMSSEPPLPTEEDLPSPHSDKDQKSNSYADDLVGLFFSSDESTDEEWEDPVLRGPQFVFTHHLTRGIKPNSVLITGWGVETVFGRMRVPESTCKTLFKNGISLDFLHRISPRGQHVELAFYLPGQRRPTTYLFSYQVEPISPCLILDRYIA